MGEKNAGGYPSKLDHWKLTSRDQVRLKAAAEAYGGTVQPWPGHEGQFQLHTETDALPILLLPGQALSQHYELWSGGGCQRRCDGANEQISDGPCLCDPEKRDCKPHSRLNVMLPDVPGIGCWRLDSTGYFAAAELAGVVDLLEMATARGLLLPARLRIDLRTQISGGQTKHFQVPTLDLDIRPLEAMQIARGDVESRPELPPAASSDENGTTPFVPLALASPVGSGATLAEGLAAVESEPEAQRTRSARAAAPIGQGGDDFLSDEPVPVPEQETLNDPPPPVASEAQQKLLVIQARTFGLTDDERHDITEFLTGDPSSKNVLAGQVDTVLAWYEIEGATKNLLAKAEALGKIQEARAAIAGKRAQVDEWDPSHRQVYLQWLTDQIAKAGAKLESQ